LPSEFSLIEWTITAGATPNDRKSASESSSTPNCEVAWLNLATLPSRTSQAPARITNQHAVVMSPSNEDRIDRKPNTTLPIVKKPGKMPL
jgi:hypothetical protein